MADPDTAVDEQDQSEVFDEENTNLEDRPAGRDDAEQFEDLVDVFDVTARAGDADEDDDDDRVGEDMDDDEIVARGRDEVDDDNADDDEDDLSDPDGLALGSERDGPDADAGDDEVELVYAGDLNDVAGAASGAQSLEAGDRSDDESDDDDEPAGVHPHQDELLDEGIEETFPASDPVSVKRIT